MSKDLDLDEIYPSDWLGVEAFPREGIVMGINEVSQEKDPKGNNQVVLWLSGPELNGKRGLNRTQAKTLAKMFGGTSQWTGQRVFVRPEAYDARTDTLVFYHPPAQQPPAEHTQSPTPTTEPESGSDSPAQSSAASLPPEPETPPWPDEAAPGE